MTDLVVIMSIYKNDKLEYVKQSVQSILTQTCCNFDYFIALDGPVSHVIESYLSKLKDDRIRLYKIAENGGLAKALNFLLEIVLMNPAYQFIARMDADDISEPTRFVKQRDFLLSNTDISCVGCWYQDIDENDNIISDHKLPCEHEELVKYYYRRTPFAHPSVFYRRSLIEQAGYYPTDTILMEDNVLWGNSLKAGLKFKNIPEYLFKFRKDKSFYIRRSGINYGWNYIVTRFKISKSLNLPFYSYLFSFLIGLIKMMPSFIIRFIYGVT